MTDPLDLGMPTCIHIRGSIVFSAGYADFPNRLCYRYLGESHQWHNLGASTLDTQAEDICGWIDLEAPITGLECDSWGPNETRPLDPLHIQLGKGVRALLFGHWPSCFRIVKDKEYARMHQERAEEFSAPKQGNQKQGNQKQNQNRPKQPVALDQNEEGNA